MTTKVCSLLALLLPWMQVLHAQNEPAAAQVQIVESRLEFRGLITDVTVHSALELYAAAGRKPSILSIESSGGTSRAAMTLGKLIFENAMDVEVDTYCHSSCANYVFTAGRQKLLSRTASLVWHGGATQPVSERRLEELLEETLSQLDAATKAKFLEGRSHEAQIELVHRSLLELIRLETQFFERIGVDQRITTLGIASQPPPLEGGRYMGWDYSLEDLATLGIYGIVLKDSIWEPEFPWKAGRIYRVTLNDIPSFRAKNPNSPPGEGCEEALRKTENRPRQLPDVLSGV